MDSLWAHQREAVEYAASRNSALLHLGVGCGKSRIACEIARGKRRVLVGCPLAVMPAWKKQAALWLQDATVVLLDRPGGAAKARQLENALAVAGDATVIVVCNYESIYRVALIEKIQWDLLIWDEVHRLKAPRGKASRWARKMAMKQKTAQKIGLSGTMIPHSPLDSWAIWLSVGLVFFSESFVAFRAYFAKMNPRVPGMVVGWRNLDHFAKIVAETTLHRRSEDVLDLPEILHEEIHYTLNRAEAACYLELEQDFCAKLADGTITPANAMVAAGRQLQCCGGFLPRDGEKVARQIGEEHPSKLARMSEWLEDFPREEPLVVFARYRADIEGLAGVMERHGRTVSELSGERRELADWQSGKTTTLIVQIQSGGVGIDLTRASYAVFYSLGHSLSEWLQAIGRLHRPGQRKTTRFYSLVAMLPNTTKRTVERRVYDALAERKEVVDELCRGYGRPVEAAV